MTTSETPDTVTYDSTTLWNGKPYRSESLYWPDLIAMRSVKRGAPVQAIVKHGDEFWTNATLVRQEEVGDYGMVRFIVLVDGTEHMVSQDRIRIA